MLDKVYWISFVISEVLLVIVVCFILIQCLIRERGKKK